MRLLIADDNQIMRTGLRILLRERPDWEICGDAANGREAISRVSDLSPDVVLLDVVMPVMNGFEAATEIRRIAPTTKIVLISMYDVPVTAAVVGVDAFVSKTALPQELFATIERVTGQSQGIRTRAQSA